MIFEAKIKGFLAKLDTFKFSDVGYEEPDYYNYKLQKMPNNTNFINETRDDASKNETEPIARDDVKKNSTESITEDTDKKNSTEAVSTIIPTVNATSSNSSSSSPPPSSSTTQPSTSNGSSLKDGTKEEAATLISTLGSTSTSRQTFISPAHQQKELTFISPVHQKELIDAPHELQLRRLSDKTSAGSRKDVSFV